MSSSWNSNSLTNRAFWAEWWSKILPTVMTLQGYLASLALGLQCLRPGAQPLQLLGVGWRRGVRSGRRMWETETETEGGAEANSLALVAQHASIFQPPSQRLTSKKEHRRMNCWPCRRTWSKDLGHQQGETVRSKQTAHLAYFKCIFLGWGGNIGIYYFSQLKHI